MPDVVVFRCCSGSEITKVLRRSETRIVVRSTLHDLPFFVRYSRLALSACSIARMDR